MIVCHVCNAECEEGLELCPVCGAQLTEEPKENTEIMTNPTILTSFEDIISAEIFKDILTDNNIPFSSSSQMGEALQVTFGGGLVSEDIYVDESDFEKASALLEDFAKSEIEFEEELEIEEEEEI